MATVHFPRFRGRLLLGLPLVCLASGLQAQEQHRLAGDHIAIHNAVGEVRLEPGTGDGVVVEVRPGGRDAARLRVEKGAPGATNGLRIVYPSGDLVYPRLGRLSRSSFRLAADGTMPSGRGSQVTVRNSGRGTEAWADLRILVPAGHRVSVHIGVGRIDAASVDGQILLTTRSGAVVAEGMSGTLRATTGSGSIRVAGARGALEAITGSGSIQALGAEGGAITLTTGSGSITAERLDGTSVQISTGSGGIRAAGVRGRDVGLKTGSGSISGNGLAASAFEAVTGSGSINVGAVDAPQARLRTGSGSVEMVLVSAVESLRISTGSGGVRVRAPGTLDAQLDLRSSSGGIHVDFPTHSTEIKRTSFKGMIGDGRGRIDIGTGSGSVRLIRN
jgi:DUF4097 and DUF4098 domain-containing protein YvlB